MERYMTSSVGEQRLTAVLEDLYKIVTEATKSVERDMRKFYDSLLKKHGVIVVPSKDQAKSPLRNGASGTSLNGMGSGGINVDAFGALPIQATGVTA
jgi:hypothetical protein